MLYCFLFLLLNSIDREKHEMSVCFMKNVHSRVLAKLVGLYDYVIMATSERTVRKKLSIQKR